MTSGGTIGAAMPVVSGGGEPQAADEKSVSYLRKEFAATAERRGRPAEFAEAMVDVDVEIPGVVAKGKLLTLTVSEAIAPSRRGVQRGHVGSRARRGRLGRCRRAAHISDVGGDARSIPDESDRRLAAHDDRTARDPRRDPDARIRPPRYCRPAVVRLVVLGALARPARGMGRTAAGRGGDAPASEPRCS